MSLSLLVGLTVLTVNPVEAEPSLAYLSESARLEYAFTPAAADTVLRLDTFQTEPIEAAPDPPPFGAKGSARWYLQGGFAVEFDDTDNRFGMFGGGISYFIAKDLSIDLELNAMYFNQEDDDAFGGNFNLLFRWHFLTRDTWSLYMDGGAGLLAATERVPGDGTNFNFTPQAGLGMTYQVGETARLSVGARWHHISNARIDDDNPGQDSILIYAGVSFPF